MTDPSTIVGQLAKVVANGDFAVPPYPAAALRLQRLLSKPNYGLAEVGEAVSADPALAATVLGAANSAYYRHSGTAITSIDRAVSRIGAKSVAALAVASGIGEAACADGILVDLKYQVWRRSVITALLCQALAPARRLEPGEAFLSGLLYGFGRCVAVACLERLLAEEVAPPKLTTAEWLEIAERHRADLARAVAEKWLLPDEVATAIGAKPGLPRGSLAMAKLLALSESVASALESGTPVERLFPSAAEGRAAAEVVATLPSAIDALIDPADPRSIGKPAPIAKPETALQGEIRSISLPIRDLRTPTIAMLGTAISVNGLRIERAEPLQESTLRHLEIETPSVASFKAWFDVALCMPEGAQHRIELNLFAADRELLARWLELYAASSES